MPHKTLTAHRPIDPSQAARWRAQGAWQDTTVSGLARQLARDDPARVTHLADGREWTARELVAQAGRLASSLRGRGYKTGDVVSFQLPNWTEAVVIDLAASMLGLVVNPIVPIYRDAEVELILADCGARALFVPPSFRGFDYAAMVERLRERLPALDLVCGVRAADADPPGLPAGDRFERLIDPAVPEYDEPDSDPDNLKLILYTSGTTGRPKGVLHSHNTLSRAIRMCAQYWNVARGDSVLMASPVTHVTGYSYGIEWPFLCGTRTVFMERWQPDEAIRLIEEEGVSCTVSATPFLQELLDIAERTGNLLPGFRSFGCGGAAVPPELIRRTRRVLPGCRAFRIYGSSEAPVITLGFLGDDEVELAATTDGKIVDYEVKLIDAAGAEVSLGVEGEICARGPALFLGYADAAQTAECFDADGYFQTGDVGYRTADDALVITGRTKDLINRGGEKLSAKEIEDLIHQHPAVLGAAVVAMPHQRLGETVCAYVIPRAGAELTPESILELLRSAGVARQKYPEKIIVVDEFPTTASGKVKKDLLRADVKRRLLEDPL